MLAEIWGVFRGWLSAGLNAIASPIQRAQLPLFSTPEQIADYLQSNCRYIPDTIDYSLHPQRLQWIMTHQQWQGITCDCDDYACWAYAALRSMQGCGPQLLTLAGRGVNEAHMICVYHRSLGSGRVEYGAIDTNGHHALTALSQREINNHFNGLYRQQNIQFTRAFPSPYPF